MLRYGMASALHSLTLFETLIDPTVQSCPYCQVVHCLRLMDTVFREFLPLVWDLQKGGLLLQ